MSTSTAGPIDVSPELSAIRSCFPALQRIQNRFPVAYFDGPGGTQVPRPVVEAMAQYLYHHNANTHWNYPTSAETDEAIAAARQALADFLNAKAGEIVFGANMTTLTFHLARTLGRRWKEGDTVVVTELDHQANVAPWEALAREKGIQLRVVPLLPESGELDWAELERALGEHPRLLAIGAASNALGTINDVRRATAMAHAAGALCLVDAVHYAPHNLVDVAATGCDFLACSAYKFYGPHVGAMYGRADALESLDPPKLAPAPDTVPEKLETGTQNHEGIVGAAAAVDFLAAQGRGATRREKLTSAFELMHEAGQRLFRRMWEGLGSIRGVRRYGVGPASPRTPTVAFTVDGISSSQVASALAGRGVFVSHGDFYASKVVERLKVGPDGLVRAGCACYTAEAEVDRLLEGVEELRGG
jgi:cysteine desulfurase family protein (TIGR01976 family)